MFVAFDPNQPPFRLGGQAFANVTIFEVDVMFDVEVGRDQ
jgi:hypothetical protein